MNNTNPTTKSDAILREHRRHGAQDTQQRQTKPQHRKLKRGYKSHIKDG